MLRPQARSPPAPAGRRRPRRGSRRPAGPPGGPAAAAAARDALGAAPGHPAARRPPAVPAGDAHAGLGLVAAAARPAADRGRLLVVAATAVVVLLGAGRPASAPDLPTGARPRRPAGPAGHQPVADRRHPVRVAAWAVAHGMRSGGRRRCWRGCAGGCSLPFTLARPGRRSGAGIGLSVLLVVPVRRGDGHRPVPAFGWLLVVVLLTTPLQSAAEEYLFRGYLSQAIAGWIRRPAGRRDRRRASSPRPCSRSRTRPRDVPTFLDRFAFGLAASAVVWLTGGLEAAIVLHAVNNVLVFVLAGRWGRGSPPTEVPDGHRAAVPRREPAHDGRLRRAGGRARRAGCVPRRTPLRWTCAPPGGPVRPGPLTRRPGGGATRAPSRRVSSSAAPRGATHGVWGNWQPDGFWFR